MLKAIPALNIGLGFAFLGTTLVAQVDEQALEQALAENELARQQLGTIAEGLPRHDRGAVERLLVATEQPMGDGPERAQRLNELRSHVDLLRLQLERLHRETAAHGPQATQQPSGSAAQAGVGSMQEPWPGGSQTSDSEPGLPGADGHIDGSSLHPITHGAVGMDSSVRDLAERALSTRGMRSGTTDGLPREFEQDPDFSADPLREAQLLFRLKRPDEAILKLKPIAEGSVVARYWLARSLEAAGHGAEALLEYAKVMEHADVPPDILESTRRDVEFLQWKRDYPRLQGSGESPR